MPIQPERFGSQKEREEKPIELERKYLVATLPLDYQQCPYEEIEQGYIEITEAVERRVRRKGQKYFYTEKIGTGAVREESEREITADEFRTLWPMTEGRRITKTRYRIPYQDRFTIETDIYHDQLEGLVTAEIEFSDEQEMAQFEPPAWLAEDVTLEKAYKNQSLATEGLPESHRAR